MVIDRCSLNVKDILEFANIVDLNDVKEIISRQIAYNSAIAKEGLTNNYGANIGSVLLNSGQDIITRAKAFAAAGSDARMSGCELPVVINSGSGNQGMTVSLPIIEYAKELNVNDEKLYRALVLGNLITIHQKLELVVYLLIVGLLVPDVQLDVELLIYMVLIMNALLTQL